MSDSNKSQRLTDLIAVRSPRESDPRPIPDPGTLDTQLFETIDNDRMAWFLGVLPPA